MRCVASRTIWAWHLWHRDTWSIYDPPHHSQRISSFDGLRGGACIAVFLFHLGSMLLPFGSDVPYALIPGTPAVMVFFVLSGVVLAIGPLACMARHRDYPWFAYFPRRVIRLCIPMFVAIAFGVFAGFVSLRLGADTHAARAVDFSSGLRTIVHDVLMQFDVLFNVSDDSVTLYGVHQTRANSPIWSMSWELWFSLTLPLAIACISRIRRERAAVACIFAAIFISYWSGYFPLRLCLMFWLGVIIAKHLGELSKTRLRRPTELACLAVALLAIEAPLANQLGIFGDALRQNVLAQAAFSTTMCAAACALVALCATDGLLRKLFSSQPLQLMGTLSFSLYLTHIIIIAGLRALLPRFGIGDPLLQAALAVAICLVGAAIFWRAIDRPSIKLSHAVRTDLTGD